MAIEDIWQSLEAFKVLVKEQVRNGMALAGEYASYYKAQAFVFAKWCQSQIGYYAQSARVWLSWCIANMGNGFAYAYNKVSHFLSNFPEYAKSAFYTVCGWLYKGYLYGYRLGAFLINNFGRIITELYNLSVKMLSAIKDGLLRFAKELGRLLAKLPEYISNLAYYAKEFLIAAGKELYRLVAKIPEFLKELLHFAQELLLAAKNALVHLFKNILPILKNLYNEISQAVSFIVNHALEAFKWVAKGVGKRLFMGMGMVYGISSVLVETLGNGINALVMNTIGLNLASYAAFATAQTVLSVALAAVALVAALRFSYLAIAGVLGMSFLSRQNHRETLRESNDQQPTQQLHPAVEQRQKTMLRQFRQQEPSHDVEQPQEQARRSTRAVNKTRRAA